MNTITRNILILIFASLLVACSTPEEKAADYVASGQNLLQEGKLKKAEIEFKNALQINQNVTDAWYGLALIHERKQEWRKAYATLNKIRELNPKHVEGRIKLAQILLASNQLDQALKDTTEIMEFAPDNAGAHALMAAVQFRLGNIEGALETVDKALELDPGNNEALLVKARVYISQKKYSSAHELLDAGIRANPENVSLYLMKIQAFQEAKDNASVIGVYQQLISKFPENPAFRNALMRNHLAQGDIDAAEKVMDEIVQSKPGNLQARLQNVAFKTRYRTRDDAIALAQSYIDDNKGEHQLQFVLADLYEANKQVDEAEKIYLGIIDGEGLQTNGLEARNKLALLKLRNGQQDEARKLVAEVLEHDKNNENALLVKSGFEISDKKYDEAIVGLRTVLRDNPESIKALGLLGRAYEANGSVQLAQDTYTSALQLQPGAPAIANQLAALLIRTGKPGQADEILLQSIAQGNKTVGTLKLLVQTKIALQEWDKAEQLANQLKAIKGQEALSQQVMGVVLQGQQKIDASIDAFREAHDLAPSASQPIVALVRSYVRNGKPAEARRFLESVISVNDKNSTAILLMAQLNIYENKPDEAKTYLRRAIDLNPGNEQGYRNLATVYARENDSDKAEAIIREGLSATNNSPALQLYLASTLERQKQFDRAIEVYEQILETNPDALVAKNNLASLLTDHKNDQESYEKARRISADLKDSNIPQFRDTYAWASVKAGLNLEESVSLLEGVVQEVIQGGGIFHFHLGEAYRKKGDMENAMASLNKALELSGPDSQVGKLARQSLQKLN